MAPRQARNTRVEAERSFEQLYRGHRGDVYRAALRELGNVHDAEDVTQAAFVDAYRAVLRGTRPQAPRAWLLKIAENVRRRRFRSSLRRPREEPLDADAGLAAEESHDQAGALLAALEALTAEQREVFLLREITGLSYEEIAQRRQSTVSSVQMLLFRARKALRDELEPPHVPGAFLSLATLCSRFDVAGLAPRAAGAAGAAALVVSASASMPAKTDPPAAQAASRPLVAATEAPVPVARPSSATVVVAPAKTPRAPEPASAPAKRRREAVAATPAAAASEPASPAAVEAAPAPQAQPPQRAPEPATPSALPVASPAVSTPSFPAPSPLEPVVEPLLEGAGAAGAAGAGAPPLPVLPLDALPPIP